MICLYAGQPKAALYYFMDAFRRCDAEKFQDYAVPLVVNGLRAAGGHSVGLSDASQYILYGPNGQGGKSGTRDGLQDPFKAYASLLPSPPFIAAPLPQRNVELLKRLQASLMASVADTTWPAGVRKKELAALARIHEALDDWPQSAQWYHTLLHDNEAPELYPRS